MLAPEGEDNIKLRIKESQHRGLYCEGLTEVCVTSREELFDLIELGHSNRHMAATCLNKESSRSHSIFILEVSQKYPTGSEKRGVLNLVDLAGSEKIAKSKVEGQSLEETKKINLSLSTLGFVIKALTTSARHVPYRDSKLTRLL